MENKFTVKELQERQAWSLNQKIDHSLGVIEQWYTHHKGKVYISFSGGKDSCVLVHLVRTLYPDVQAVFSTQLMNFQKFINSLKLLIMY